MIRLKDLIRLFGLIFISASGLKAEEAPYIMGALGDSISAGFNAYRYGDNRELSWTGGLDTEGIVQSHARRLKALLGDRPVKVVNEAFVGAESYQLPRQANRLLRQKPDYVTIAIGANDACTWYEDYLEKLESYRRNVTIAIDKIIAVNPKVKIVLVSVPSIRIMYEIGIHHQGCQKKWDTMNVCRPLLATERTSDERERFYERLTHLNQVIAEIAASYPSNVRLADRIGTFVFDESMISSLDCFHPSIKGHNFISELSFDPTWY